jgi:MFS family permease
MNERERRWGLAAAISSIAVFGVGIGIGAPLLSLMLESRGVDASLNGLNAAVSFFGVILGPLLMPRLVARFGFKYFLLAAVPLSTVAFLLLKAFDDLGIWFILRFSEGVLGSSIFAATEAWINQLAGDERRGRILGFYTASLSAGFALGPIVLSQLGIAGWGPFIARAATAAIAMLPLLMVPGGRGKLDLAGTHPVAVMARMKPIVAIVILFGIYEGSAVSLLSVWGERAGLSTGLAASLVATVFIGAIALQIPIGYLSDRIGRNATMRLCAVLGIAGAALLPLIADRPPLLIIVLVIWGGFATGLYPVALGMIGDRFRGGDLLNANAGLVVSYGIGAFIGPSLAGVAMDLWNPNGMMAVLALLFAVLLVTTLWRGDAARPIAASSPQTGQ